MLNIHEYISDNNHFKQLKVDDLLFVEYKCMVDEVKAGIWSDVNYFVFVSTGKKMWRSIKSNYVVEAGDSLFVKKGANLVHQYFDEKYCALMVFIPDDFIQKFINRFSSIIRAYPEGSSESDAIIRIRLDEYLEAYVHSLGSFFASMSHPDKHLLSLKFEELLLNIFTRPLHKDVARYLSTLNQSQQVQLEQIMEENFTYKLTLEEFASLCNMSLSSFKRSFNKLYGTSPGKWLSNKRLDFAAHLLRNTDKNINETAFESGFEDTSSFIRVFKQKFKTTPLQYRLADS